MADLFLITVQLHNAYIVYENHNIAPTYQRRALICFLFFPRLFATGRPPGEAEPHRATDAGAGNRPGGRGQPDNLVPEECSTGISARRSFFGARRLPGLDHFWRALFGLRYLFPHAPSWSLIALLSPCLR